MQLRGTCRLFKVNNAPKSDAKNTLPGTALLFPAKPSVSIPPVLDPSTETPTGSAQRLTMRLACSTWRIDQAAGLP